MMNQPWQESIWLSRNSLIDRHQFVINVSGNTIFADTTYAQNRSDLNEVHSMFTKEKHENSHA